MFAASRIAFVSLLLARFCLGDCDRDVTLNWVVPTTAASSAPAAYHGGYIFNVEPGTSVSRIDESSGELSWTKHDDTLVGGPTIGAHAVFVARVGSICGFHLSNGNLVSQFMLVDHEEVPCHDGAPLLVNDRLYFATSSGRVYCLGSGMLSGVWVTDLGAENGVSASVAIWKGYVVVGTFSGNVFLLDADTGAVVRSYSTPDVPSFNPSNGVIFGIQSDFLVHNDVVFYHTHTSTNHLVALNLNTMTPHWRSTLTEGSYSYSTPTVYHRMLYTTTHEGRLYSVQLHNGEISWSTPIAERVEVRGPISFVENTAIVTTSAGSVLGVHLFDRSVSFWFTLGAAGLSHASVTHTVGNRYLFSGDRMVFPMELDCRVVE